MINTRDYSGQIELSSRGYQNQNTRYSWH